MTNNLTIGAIRVYDNFVDLTISKNDVIIFDIINMQKEPETWVKNTILKYVFIEINSGIYGLYKTLPKGEYFMTDLKYSILAWKNKHDL